MLADATTLHPRFQDADVLATLRARWSETRRVRLTDALAPGLAERLEARALDGPFGAFARHEGEIRCMFWRRVLALPVAADDGGDEVLLAARRLLLEDLPALAVAITGQRLRPAGDGARIVFDLYRKGSFLDAHTDQGADRLVAYVLGLTRADLPPAAGGQLEFLSIDEREVVDRISPGFGAIDLFTIFPLLRPHRVSILTEDAVRLSVNGWLTHAGGR